MLKTCTFLVAGALASSLFAAQADAKGPRALFETSVIASSGGSVPIAGVQSTGVAFEVDPGGEIKVNEDGDIKVEFTGLLHQNDTPTAEDVFASLVCNGTIVYSTAPFPIDFDTGSAKIEEDGVIDTTVAAKCGAPIVLIRRDGCSIAGGCNSDVPTNTRWLAVSGFIPPVLD